MTRDSDARHLAETAGIGAAEAMRECLVIKGQARIIAWILGAIGALVVGMFGWLVTEVRAQGRIAVERATFVAEKTILESDRNLDRRLREVASEAAREAIRAARNEPGPDRITGSR